MFPMFSIQMVKAAIHLHSVFPDLKYILLSGHCEHCHKEIRDKWVSVFKDETPREKFTEFWESLAIDCKLEYLQSDRF